MRRGRVIGIVPSATYQLSLTASRWEKSSISLSPQLLLLIALFIFSGTFTRSIKANFLAGAAEIGLLVRQQKAMMGVDIRRVIVTDLSSPAYQK